MLHEDAKYKFRTANAFVWSVPFTSESDTYSVAVKVSVHSKSLLFQRLVCICRPLTPCVVVTDLGLLSGPAASPLESSPITMVSRTIIAPPAPSASVARKPRVRQVGFETAVTAIIFAQKLKVAVARSHTRSAASVGRSRAKSMSVRGAMGDNDVPCRTVTADGLLGLPTVRC